MWRVASAAHIILLALDCFWMSSGTAREGAVLPGAMGSEGGKTVHEEVKTRDEEAESHGELALRKI